MARLTVATTLLGVSFGANSACHHIVPAAEIVIRIAHEAEQILTGGLAALVA